MKRPPLIVAWISNFPLEWLPDLPRELAHLPREHPATWQLVLLREFEGRSDLRLHILLLRKNIAADVTFERGAVTFHVLKVPRASRAPSFFWVDTLLLRRRLKQIQPDIVHAWGTERGAGLIASRLGYPYLVTIQGLLTWYKELVPLGRYERFATMLEMISLRRARIVTTESAFAVKFLREKFPHLAVKQAEHAPNRLFHEVTRAPQMEPIRLLTVGTPGFRKGTDLLLEALNTLVHEFRFELTMVGTVSSAYFDAQQARVSDELGRRIIFRKNLNAAEVAREMATATMLVLPTRADTSPNAVKEAVVSGVPVVASAIGGVVDYVLPEKNGLLVEAGNLESLIGQLRRAMSHPQFARGVVEGATLADMRNYLSPAEMNRRFFAAYEETLTRFPHA
jgi:glycosyltransferase involved in cell wall biosynthesis